MVFFSINHSSNIKNLKFEWQRSLNFYKNFRNSLRNSDGIRNSKNTEMIQNLLYNKDRINLNNMWMCRHPQFQISIQSKTYSFLLHKPLPHKKYKQTTTHCLCFWVSLLFFRLAETFLLAFFFFCFVGSTKCC